MSTRSKIITIVGIFFAGAIGIHLIPLKPSQPVGIVFRGYWDWQNNTHTNGNLGLQADFFVTNYTARRFYTSPNQATIQIKTVDGWTNYVSINDESWRSDRHPISPHGVTWLLRDFPKSNSVWRLHVSYYEPTPEWMRLRFLSFLKLPDRKNGEIWSETYSNTPPGRIIYAKFP